MNIYTIEYSGKSFEGWSNLGDDIQSLAAKRLLPRVDGSISREKLKHPVTPGVLSMNGYFLGGVEWPPAPELVPLFFCFPCNTGLCCPGLLSRWYRLSQKARADWLQGSRNYGVTKTPWCGRFL